MITELTKNIFLFNIPLPGNPLKNLNSFFIRGTKRNLLIDTGFNMPESMEVMQACLSELHVNMAETDIFLTHLHSDHTGLAPSIADPESNIFIGSIDLELLPRFLTPEYWKIIDDAFISFGFPEKELLDNRSKNPAIVYLPEKDCTYTALENGDVLDLGDRRLEVIWTPGHTPGHLCLYDADNKLFFCGDHVIFDISPNITSWPGTEDSLGDYLQSLKKVQSLDVSHTFSAHRHVEGTLQTRIDELLAHHERRLEEAAQAVTSIKKATVYEVASQMTWSIRAKDWKHFPVAQKWFAVGEAHAHLEYLRLRKQISMKEEAGIRHYSPCI